MIYRVGDSGDPTFDYSSQLKPAKNTESREKFSLDKQKEQEYTAKKEEKGEDKKLHEKPGAQNKMREGVKLELSVGKDSPMTSNKEKTAESQAAAGPPFFLLFRI